MFTAYMWVYPWDLVDEGIEEALDRIQEMGASGICLATVYHSIEHLRMHEALAGRPRTYRHSGAAYFQPDAAKYAGTRIHPIVAEWPESGNPLADIAEACAARGIGLRSWTVCCHNSEMVRRRPETAVRTIFGDINPTWMCPLNPDVGEYLRALVEDLSSNYPFEAVELESPAFNAARHYHTHAKMGLEPGPLERFLLSLCFCESCRQRARDADVDIDQVVGVVQGQLETWFAEARPSDVPIDALLDRKPSVRRFVQWRTHCVSEVIRGMKSTCRCELILYAESDVAGSGLDLAEVSGDISGAVGTCYSKTGPVGTESIERTARWLGQALGGLDRASIGLMTYPPAAPDGPSLARQVHRVADLGAGTVHLYHYGIMPDVCLTWTRQALRKPRRES
ncbi:MAG: hypothetical protein JXQ73_24070 [Phycisphaerae bacterium]|nr:hypothetical protein [Phycisphaerae bacterium]